MEEEVKVAVLETRLKNFETLVTRLDSAIEKIAEVNNNVSRMLAVHCLLYTSPSPRDYAASRMPSSA